MCQCCVTLKYTLLWFRKVSDPISSRRWLLKVRFSRQNPLCHDQFITSDKFKTSGYLSVVYFLLRLTVVNKEIHRRFNGVFEAQKPQQCTWCNIHCTKNTWFMNIFQTKCAAIGHILFLSLLSIVCFSSYRFGR